MDSTSTKAARSILLNIPADDTAQKLERILGSLVDYRVEHNMVVFEDSRDKLGQGKYGDVWMGLLRVEKGSQAKNGGVATKEVAVKTLRQAAGTPAERTRTACRFARELKVWAGLLHCNILELVAFYLSESLENAWLLSPYEPKGNLADFMKKETPSQETKLELVFDIVSGLRYLHSQSPTIVHGDLKPANILIGGDGFAKLCDFGLAKALEERTGLTSEGPARGTLCYMSPELFEEDTVVTLATDVWGLACVAGEVLTGHVPYDWVAGQHRVLLQISLGKPPIPQNQILLPVELGMWIQRCWKLEATERPSVSDCIYTLKRYMETAFPTSSRLSQAEDPSPSTTQSQTDDFFVELHREKLKKQPEDHPDYAMTLMNLAFTLTERFDTNGKPDDLEEAIALHRRALELRPDDHYGRLSSLRNLAVVLGKRFETSGDRDDLDECIKFRREALRLCPVGHPERPVKIFRLAAALSILCKRWLDRGASDESVNLYREALPRNDVKNPDYLPRLQSLACALQGRFETFGDAKDLEEAIKLYREAVNLCSVTHPKRSQSIESLAFALLVSSQTCGDAKDATESVELWREYLKRHPAGNPDRSRSLYKLGSALHQRFTLLGDEQDLEEAITLLRESLKLCSEGHPNRKLIFGSLGEALRSNFKRGGDLKQHIEAVKYLREAVQLMKPGDFSHAEVLQGLGTTLMDSYQIGRDANDIDEAIGFHLQALELCPGRHAFRYDRFLALGKSLRARSGTNDIAEARRCYQEALELVPGDYPGNLRRQETVKAMRDEMEAEGGAAGNEEPGAVDNVTLQMEGVVLKGE